MKKDFLVVFEAGPNNYSAFAPDIPGCYALGDTVETARDRFLDAVKAHLDWMAADDDPIPEPVTTSFDFAREDKDEVGHYVVEWLPIPLPTHSHPARNAA